jgi:hypothetical protein
VPCLCEFYPGICRTTEEKARKNLSQGKKNLSHVKENLSHSTVYILPKAPTHYKALNKINERQRPLLKYLERNICKLCKCLPHKTIHTHHFPQTFPSSMAQLFFSLGSLTNHGSFRSYLRRMNKPPSPNCNCPKKTVQTAHHLVMECSLWSKDRPTVLKSLPPTPWFCSTT